MVGRMRLGHYRTSAFSFYLKGMDFLGKERCVWRDGIALIVVIF